MKISCFTCKYGYEDERLGIPMCHHPKRFSEDCVDFNMHEEKETEESEKPNNHDGLDEAAKEDAFNNAEDSIEYMARLAGFIAGAKWQKEQDTRDMVMSDNRHFNKVYELGKKDMKEQMMKEAVEGTVMDFSSNQPRPQVDVYVDPNKYCTGDKVRIIVIPNTDKK